MLTHWVRDRSHDQLPLEFVVNKMTAQTAALYGLGDRGALVPGLLGDANVIDFDGLCLPLPELVHDLPAGARRFVQGSEGYVATIKRGTPILRGGEDQGERPGQLIRGARPAPN
jgi:N-acyl-D-aspartate/D-glutamate deacylase